MTKSLEYLRDIRALINEIYEDETDENRLASRDCFRNYCTYIEKELKALEIIKEKRVNVSLLSCSEWLDFYNQEIAYKEKELTQEEYDLLKEVLDL